MRTVGVEEELLLVDARSGEPRAVAGVALARRPTDHDEPTDPAEPEYDGALEAELQQQQIELGTRTCTSLDEVEHEVRSWRRQADVRARRAGARVAALATCPVPVQPRTTIKARYLRMVEHFGLTTVEQLTCGCHVHVGVDSAEEGVAVLDRIRVWLPTLIALTANSPFWQGTDSGYASFRTQAWNRFPSAGPTPVFGSPEAYASAVRTLIGSGVLLDEGMVYFDARLSRHYPTVEVRVADVCLDARDTAMTAGLVRALVEQASRDWRSGRPAPSVPTEVLRLASWRASRSGTTGDLVDPLEGRPRPAADQVAALLEHLRPVLADLGDADRVESRVTAVLAGGTGAVWQRAVAEETGSLAGLIVRAVEHTQG